MSIGGTMKKSMVKHSLGKKENFLTETVKFIKKEVGAVEDKLEEKGRSIAIQSGVLGASIGIVVGIVGTLLMQKYVTGTPSSQVPPTPPKA